MSYIIATTLNFTCIFAMGGWRSAAGRFDLSQGRKSLFALNWVGIKANCVMYTFLALRRSPHSEEDDAMLENEVNGLAELDDDILTFDVPDDALERAAPPADRRVITLYCTRDPLSCGWPIVVT
jgi:hypothetical protein